MHMHSKMNGKYLANFGKCDNFPLVIQKRKASIDTTPDNGNKFYLEGNK